MLQCLWQILGDLGRDFRILRIEAIATDVTVTTLAKDDEGQLKVKHLAWGEFCGN